MFALRPSGYRDFASLGREVGICSNIICDEEPALPGQAVNGPSSPSRTRSYISGFIVCGIPVF